MSFKPFLVVLSGAWQSPEFRRTVRDKKNEVITTLVFNKRIPVEIETAEIARGIQDDIGSALMLAAKQERGEGKAKETRYVSDPQGTVDYVVQLAQERIDNEQPLTAHQRRHYENWLAEKQADIQRKKDIEQLRFELDSVSEQLENDPENVTLIERRNDLKANLAELESGQSEKPPEIDESQEQPATPSDNPESEQPEDDSSDDSSDDSDEEKESEKPLDIQVEDAETELSRLQSKLEIDPDNTDLKKQVASAKRKLTNLKKKLDSDK